MEKIKRRLWPENRKTVEHLVLVFLWRWISIGLIGSVCLVTLVLLAIALDEPVEHVSKLSFGGIAFIFTTLGLHQIAGSLEEGSST